MGRPDYQSLSATLPSKSWESYTPDITTPVDAGSNVSVTLYSPAGTISTVISVYLNAPATTGGTSGNQQMSIDANNTGVTEGSAPYTDPVSFNNGYWSNASTQSEPPGGSSPQSWMLGRLVMDASMGIQFSYSSDSTSGTQDGPITIYVGVVEEDIP
ncbi:MAG: hypothetical protein ACYCW6_25625 [Candidatus Xenobia bacterium]